MTVTETRAIIRVVDYLRKNGTTNTHNLRKGAKLPSKLPSNKGTAYKQILNNMVKAGVITKSKAPARSKTKRGRPQILYSIS